MSDRLLLRLRTAFTWLAGESPWGGWHQLLYGAPLILLGLVLAMALARWLDAFLLGEEGAATIGVPVEGAKTAVVAVAALLTAAAVTLSGLIGFVGLLVPHAVRLVAGPSHARLIPAAPSPGPPSSSSPTSWRVPCWPPWRSPSASSPPSSGGPSSCSCSSALDEDDAPRPL